VRRYLEVGGVALLLVTSNAMDETLASLAELKRVPALDEYDRRYALLERIDFEHPALREFGDPRWRDVTDVHFWHYRILDPALLPDGAKMIARFDTGDPAWIGLPVGSGSLFVMMAGWHPRDSQLSLSSKFLPLLFSIFADRGPQVNAPRQFFVGDPLPLDENETAVTLPSSQRETIAAGAPFHPDTPGVYHADDGARPRSFAVNLRPSESELAPLATESLAALGVPVERDESSAAVTEADGRRKLRDKEAEANEPLWRWAVAILLGMLVVEAWLAARPGRAQPLPEGAVP
jgi:hypothetical protein